MLVKCIYYAREKAEIMELMEQVYKLCNEWEENISLESDNIPVRLLDKTLEVFAAVRKQPAELQETVTDCFHEIALKCNPVLKVWLYSVLISVTHRVSIMEELLEYIISESEFLPEVKYFLYQQTAFKIFQTNYFDNENTRYLRWKLLEQIVALYKEKTKHLLKYIPYEQRNTSMVFVIAEQVLSEYHAPTKIAFEKCKFLIEKMQKKVLLISTEEILSLAGRIPYFYTREKTKDDFLRVHQFREWKGIKIPYFQCDDNMPNIDDLCAILTMIQNTKPEFVLSIGAGNSILANLIDEIVPVLTYGTTSEIQETMTSCQTLARKLETNDFQLLDKAGADKKTIIEIKPKTVIDAQKSFVTRQQIGLPEDKFIIAIVGNRLESEADEKFMHMLEDALDEEMFVAVIGRSLFDPFENYMQKKPGMRNKIKNLGYSDQLLSWLERCDLYVNPYRRGGGLSAIYELYQGVPVVSLAYGDVFRNVGEEFCTESYDAMAGLIKKYKNDKEFYQKMSVFSKERAKTLTENEEDFKSIIEEFLKRTNDKVKSETL